MDVTQARAGEAIRWNILRPACQVLVATNILLTGEPAGQQGVQATLQSAKAKTSWVRSAMEETNCVDLLHILASST